MLLLHDGSPAIGGKPRRLAKRSPRRTNQAFQQNSFATWCIVYAMTCVLPLELNADIVAWIVTVMQSSGAMQGIENISALEKTLTTRRTQLRFQTDLEWQEVILTTLRTWENGGVVCDEY